MVSVLRYPMVIVWSAARYSSFNEIVKEEAYRVYDDLIFSLEKGVEGHIPQVGVARKDWVDQVGVGGWLGVMWGLQVLSLLCLFWFLRKS
jgi:hypothetical protein